jgi:hypothetical protein
VRRWPVAMWMKVFWKSANHVGNYCLRWRAADRPSPQGRGGRTGHNLPK